MLEQMRGAAKSWVAKILLGLLVLSFAIWGVNDVFRSFQSQDIATVGDQTISSQAFQTTLNRELQNVSRQSGQALSLEDARKMGLDQEVLDQMIATTSLDAQRDRLKLAISDQAVVARVHSNPAFLNTDGQFNPQRFQNVLQQNGLTEAAFLAGEKNNMAREALSSVAGADIALPRTLTEALVRYKDETRDARYVSFSVNEADLPQPTDDDLKKQYDSTPAAYTAPEFRSVAVLSVSPADVASKIDVTDDELKAGFEENKAQFEQPEKRTVIQLVFPDVAQADKAKARIDKGEDILKIAAERGMKTEDITFTDRVKGDFLDPAIADAAFSLAEGTVSAPVSGSLSTALLKVTKITPGVNPTLADVRDQVRKLVQMKKAREEIEAIYADVEDDRAGDQKFEDIAAKRGIPLTVVPAVSAAGTDKAGAEVTLPDKDAVLKAIFASDVGVENDAVSNGDGYVWYEVREVVPEALKPLTEVKDAVRADWQAATLRSFAGEKAKAILAKAGTSTKLDTIATEVNGTVKTVTAVKRNETSAEFDAASTTALFSSPEKTLTWALEGDGRSARIIEVSKVTVPTLQAASSAATTVVDTVKPGLQSDLAEVYVRAVRGEMDVSINQELWSSIRGASTTP